MCWQGCLPWVFYILACICSSFFILNEFLSFSPLFTNQTALPFNYHQNHTWHDTSGKNNNHWVYWALRILQLMTHIKYDAAQMLRYSIEQKIMTSDEYIAVIQVHYQGKKSRQWSWERAY
jgi:hypothetical protein